MGWRPGRRRGWNRGGDSLRDERPAAIEFRPAGQAEAAGVRDVSRAGAAGHIDSVEVAVQSS
jgi:hypothetical protein